MRNISRKALLSGAPPFHREAYWGHVLCDLPPIINAIRIIYATIFTQISAGGFEVAEQQPLRVAR